MTTLIAAWSWPQWLMIVWIFQHVGIAAYVTPTGPKRLTRLAGLACFPVWFVAMLGFGRFWG